MNIGELGKFKDLYLKITNLKAVKCRLHHERIRYDRETNLPIPRNLAAEISYKNIGLCSPKVRTERLACGHTMARYLLEDALVILASKEVETKSLKAELKEVTDRIHNLDHQKSFAEKHLACLIKKKYADAETNLTGEIEKAKTAIKDIENLHSKCVEKIGQVRDSIVSEMLLFIENS